MSKKLYDLNLDHFKKSTHLHKDVSNPTCVAIIKALYKMKQEKDFKGQTGDNILRYALKNGLWSTRQADDKLMTTWAYYVKDLKIHGGVVEIGSVDNIKMSIADLLK